MDFMPLRVLLISTYEMGRQPFGLASPTAWLRAAGFEVTCLDLSQQPLNRSVSEAQLIGLYLPMHTATRIAAGAIRKIRPLNPAAQLCAFGLYAPLNAEHLRGLGVAHILGGEFEAALVELARSVAAGNASPLTDTSLERLPFRVPDRSSLPSLDKYAKLRLPDGTRRVVGYTEASRGCKHLCRHCPIVPVYQGKFRVVPRDVVLADIRQQVEAGARHITFGDPDFFNGVGHAMEIVRRLHREFPALSFDVTIKVEHLLQHAGHLRELRDCGCAFVTSAVESVDDRILALLDKGHTRADFYRVAQLFRQAGLALSPTFVAFTPWTTLRGYADLLDTIEELQLVDHVAPVQWAIRLLIPSASRLLELPQVRKLAGAFDSAALSFPWKHRDARVDELQRQISDAVQALGENADRRTAFEHARDLLRRARNGEEIAAPLPEVPPAPARATIPYLTEPWYC